MEAVLKRVPYLSIPGSGSISFWSDVAQPPPTDALTSGLPARHSKADAGPAGSRAVVHELPW